KSGLPIKSRKFLFGIRSLCPFIGNSPIRDNLMLIDRSPPSGGIKIFLFTFLCNLSMHVIAAPPPVKLAKSKGTYFSQHPRCQVTEPYFLKIEPNAYNEAFDRVKPGEMQLRHNSLQSECFALIAPLHLSPGFTVMVVNDRLRYILQTR